MTSYFDIVLSDYQNGEKSPYGGFRETSYGYVMMKSSHNCDIHVGDEIGHLIVSEVITSRKKGKTLIVAKEM